MVQAIDTIIVYFRARIDTIVTRSHRTRNFAMNFAQCRARLDFINKESAGGGEATIDFDNGSKYNVTRFPSQATMIIVTVLNRAYQSNNYNGFYELYI